MKKLKILYVEDSIYDVEMVVRTLKKSEIDFELKQADGKNTFEYLLDVFDPDLVLSDHTLFQFDSVEAFEMVRKKNKNIPFILVTGTVSEEFAVNILKNGATDYILKSNLSRLPIAVTNAIKEKEIEKEKINYQLRLEEKNKNLNTLIYKITHDLRGPVCSILGLIEIVKKEVKDNDHINKISESTLKLDNILHSLIDTMYTRDANVTADKVNFEEIVNEIIKKFEFIEQYKNVDIKFQCHQTENFYSDGKIISSILQNIIENACKYKDHTMSNSKVLIEVDITSEMAEIKIADNGIGIDPEIQDKVFDMFFRGTVDSKGSGLGLYLVKTGVEKLKGNVRLESALKKGTKFYINLPNLKK